MNVSTTERSESNWLERTRKSLFQRKNSQLSAVNVVALICVCERERWKDWCPKSNNRLCFLKIVSTILRHTCGCTQYFLSNVYIWTFFSLTCSLLLISISKHEIVRERVFIYLNEWMCLRLSHVWKEYGPARTPVRRLSDTNTGLNFNRHSNHKHDNISLISKMSQTVIQYKTWNLNFVSERTFTDKLIVCTDSFFNGLKQLQLVGDIFVSLCINLLEIFI